MLIKCPECSHDLSDKAPSCPNCGYVQSRKKYYAAKKLRLPNGFGRITKITGKNLRKPYRAMVTVGIDLNGKPIGKILRPEGYFKTYNEAYKALVEYNMNPFDLSKNMTFEEVYDRWFKEYVSTKSKSYEYQIKAAFNYCDPIKSEPIRFIKPSHLRTVISEGVRIDSNGNSKPITPNMRNVVKLLFLGVFDYALERDLIDKNIAKDVRIGKVTDKKIKEERKPHTNYTDDEVKLLWEHEDDLFASIILIQCYSGFRPGELFDLELSNIDLDNWTMTGGNKTDNGKDRTVPIHSKIKHLVKRHYDLAKKYNLPRLIVYEKQAGISNPSTKYMRQSMGKNLERLSLGLDHRWHDGRVTFVSLAKKYSVNEYAIKRIVGHAIEDLTEKVYTIRDIEWLRSEIEKIK